jgi:hypothetical protein
MWGVVVCVVIEPVVIAATWHSANVTAEVVEVEADGHPKVLLG